mgnify:CR=1 FL=1
MANRKNKVKFGLKNCHYALVTIDEDGKVTFGTPVSMPGSVSLSLDAEGDNDPFYADDSVYYMVSNNNGYSGDFELALIPESFLVDVLHETEDANGVLVENKDVEPEHFALRRPAEDPPLPVLLQRDQTFDGGRYHRGQEGSQDGEALAYCFAASERAGKGQNRYEHQRGNLQQLVHQGL